MKIKIIGAGVVGQNMKKLFPDAVFHDPAKGYNNPDYADLAFVCVPTEMMPGGKCDTSIVENVLKEDHATVHCIKSTVPPGFTEKMDKEIRPLTCFSPEYYGGTLHANTPEYDFLIVGGCYLPCHVVIEAYKKGSHPNLRIYRTDAKTAELVKYMENSFLAAKVTFCNEFARIAERIGVDYNELRELWLADPRIGRSHTFVYPDKPYYDSHCLNKDIPALIHFCKSIGYDAGFIQAIDSVNAHFKAGGK